MKKLVAFTVSLFCFAVVLAQRQSLPFNSNWKFFLGDTSAASDVGFNDASWRHLNLPHDWSIEGSFRQEHPTTFNQGALPAGVGWYRKTFQLPVSMNDRKVYINFDGVYRNGEVWINGHRLGKRPYGYSSFRYELTPYLTAGSANVIAVRVDNSAQPSSRWYTGSGIYRKVWLEVTSSLAVDHWGVYVCTPTVTAEEATIKIESNLTGAAPSSHAVRIEHKIYDPSGKLVATAKSAGVGNGTTSMVVTRITRPKRWSVASPSLYKMVSSVFQRGKIVDTHQTTFGIRSIRFDAANGFFLNEKPLKILGVCNHHDLGALGAAFKRRAAERQLQMLKAMGCNAIRTAHNPPAPELLDLCDSMGFLVMDEAFDMWKKRKNRFDYNIDFDAWHQQDLQDMVKRDRNHASIIIWSIGNEIREQFDSSGTRLAKRLVDLVKQVDSTRPVMCALTENLPEKNFIYQSAGLDLLGFNYKQDAYAELPKRFPNVALIASETASALATRGYYEMPSDSSRVWPPNSKSKTHGNAAHTASAYDNTYAYWGDTHENSWKAVKKYPFMAGTFVWSGFDFLGEPVPYEWPSRSSYYGIIDLAGFPKDVYYMYQSEWTAKPVLHIFPHWNWQGGQVVDVWAYYNNADEVELFLNGKSLGVKNKSGDSLHVLWRIPFEPGTLSAISRRGGKVVLKKEIKTAGPAARIELVADRKRLHGGGDDLSFVTVKILDKDGNLVPFADNNVRFTVKGAGYIAGVDNGNPVSMESFKADVRRAFYGKCLLIVGAKNGGGMIQVEANAEGLSPSKILLSAN